MQWSIDKIRRTLTGKLVLVVVAAALILTPTTYLVLHLAVAPSFSRLEQEMVQRQVDRVRNGIDDFGKEVLRATRDYADWDDSYEYLEAPTEAFEQETLSPLAQQNLDVEFFGYVRFNGEVVRGEAVDLTTGTPLPDESSRLRGVVTSPTFLENAKAEKTFRTFVNTPMGVYALATGWIRKSDGSGTPKGFVVMGRRMESSTLSDILRVPVKILTGAQVETVPAVLRRPPYHGSIYADEVVESFEGLRGAEGNLVGVVRFSTSRSISFLGTRTILLGSSLVLAVILAVLVLLSVLMRRVAIRRLEVLADHMRSANAQVGFSHSPLGEGDDEIASLARSFDETFDQLKEAREQLREQSYTQGKADLAAGALHNLSNALGPVRVLQQKWMMQNEASWMRNLARAVAELKQGPDDQRKTALQDFVLAAAERVISDNQERSREMEESRAALDQAVDILTSEHEFAYQKLPVEPVGLVEMLSLASAIARHYGNGDIEVVLPEQAPSVLANKLQLAQLLGNLMKNAAESIYALDPAEKRIRVSVENEGTEAIRILVVDNGEGFDAASSAKLFERGFSTRRENKGGLGLHWCANSAAAMQGNLKLLSDGRGRGATAVLTLPSARSSPAPSMARPDVRKNLP